jgi:hypothetical protein
VTYQNNQMNPKTKGSLQSPATLFLSLWKTASALTGPNRTNACAPDALFEDEVAKALQQQEPQEVFHRLIQLVAGDVGLRYERHGRILSVMRAIDKMYFGIHPRAFRPTHSRKGYHAPRWLTESRDKRLLLGYYDGDDDRCLVPRGPLLRSPRDEVASSADSLADRFAALTVVPRAFLHEDRPVSVSHKIIGLSLTSGIAPGTKPGEESVVFVPVAEHGTDLSMAERTSGGKLFVDFRLNPSLNGAEVLQQALGAYGVVDIVIAPELVISEEHADQLQDMLLTHESTARVVIAGSGITRSTDEDGLVWNEARVINGCGAELWRQRKIWPAGLKKVRATGYNLSDPGAGLVFEDTAAGDRIVVVDADGFGRCIILICQDIEALPLSGELIRTFQPDWIFSPILDPGIREGGWIHQRAFDLSAISNARFLVACSTSLARARAETVTEPACGLAIGPKHSFDGDAGRVFALAYAEGKSAPRHAAIRWRSGEWNESTLGSKPKKSVGASE